MTKFSSFLIFIYTIFALYLCPPVHAQMNPIELNFSAVNNAQFQLLDSITISNLTQGLDTVLYYPDTVLTLDIISTIQSPASINENYFNLEQNFPNPFKKQTEIKLTVNKEENIKIVVTDPMGRLIEEIKATFQTGIHSFNFSGGGEHFYFLTAIGKMKTKSIKMLAAGGNIQSTQSLNYLGYKREIPIYKVKEQINNFLFISGDELMFIGHSEGLESALTASPENSQSIEFQFATNIPCPGIPTIFYGDQEYNTIQIRSQCWLKESINFEMEESWCVNNNPDNCEEYGRLYLWESAITICPEGWHLPSDYEWRILEGVADSQHRILDPVWDYSGGWRGTEAGTNLKSLSGWYGGGNGLDLFGFTGKAGGYQLPNGNSGGSSIEGGFWTSTAYDENTAWYRMLQFSKIGVYRFPDEIQWGLYVRCVKD